jgi:hypothetical protein
MRKLTTVLHRDSQTACRRTSVFTSTEICSITARLLLAPLLAVLGKQGGGICVQGAYEQGLVVHIYFSEAGVLDEPYSTKPAQRSSHTGPPGYIGWTQFQPM